MYKEKGSRFLAFAYPVKSGEEIRSHLAALQKAYFDARHHCYAWILGVGKNSFRAHDAGEPNHAAGDPILGQLRSRALTNVLVVVVRYFGGTKLGVGGLASAYKRAAADALDHATIVEEDLQMTIQMSYDYAGTPEVMRLIKEFDLEITAQSFEARCLITVVCKRFRGEALLEKVALLKAAGKISDYRDIDTPAPS